MGSFVDAQVFSTLNTNSCYWKIKYFKEDRVITALTSNLDLYQIMRMPFGLRNASATLQRVMDVVLSTFQCKYALVYSHYKAEFFKMPEYHIEHESPVFFGKKRYVVLSEDWLGIEDTTHAFLSIETL